MTRRRSDLLPALVVLSIAVIALLRALDLLPAAVYDVLVRSAPVLLVLAGLVIVLRGRVPFGSVLAVLLSVGLVAGLTALAYSLRAQQPRTERQQAINQTIPDEVGLLRVQMSTLIADVELLPLAGDTATVTGAFTGSPASEVVVDFLPLDDGSATLTIAETPTEDLPMLANIGRGALRLELPSDVPLDVELRAESGDISLNLTGTLLERLNLDLARGDALVRLPEYDPVLSGPDDSLGTLAVRNGDITVFVPDGVAARLELARGGSGIEPVYDPTLYNFLFNTLLEARTIDTADVVMNYQLVVPRGQVRLDVVE